MTMEQTSNLQPAWKPIGAIERRVLGVLVEKAKTTPDAYPLTLNALRNGCNQKSNRDPQLDLNEDQLEDALENLRRDGAAIEVQGNSRAAKYRHAMYEWMGVSKVEAAVMTELLLRGAQTVGELRGRAARMEPIPDLGALTPVLNALKERGLVIGLTPPGRGHIVTHALYTPREMERLKAEHGASSQSYGDDESAARTDSPSTSPANAPSSAPTRTSSTSPPTPATAPSAACASPTNAAADFASELAQMRTEFAAVQRHLEETIAELQQRVDDLERFRQEVSG